MDILNAKPQYKVIIKSGCEIPLEIFEHTQLEIGFGNGAFTVQYAESNPEIMLYGLEISGSCVLRCSRKAGDLRNLKILCTDARYMLRELFPDNSLEKIIMNFPCPWSKNTYAHKRVTEKDFSDSLASVLKIGGIFEMVSDDEDYSKEVWRVLGKHEALESVGFVTNPERSIATKYERKWLEMGKNIFKLTFRKTKNFTVERRVAQEMHIKIKKQVNKSDLDALKNTSGKDESKKAFWRFGKNFINASGAPAEERFLLETLTSDDEFEQKFYINISPRNEEFLIRLDKTGSAFLTPGVRLALKDVAEKLGTIN